MTSPHTDAWTAAAAWLAVARDEIRVLGLDAYRLAGEARAQWHDSPRFRASVFRELLRGLAAAIMQGPRAAVLMLAAALGNLIISVANMLEHPSAFESSF
ncbi:hypothetical protein QQX13_00235 [Demequina sp. SYSU T00068]|uniref:hypothetical protein n=1 Tax=Demequina lignilytica TaxID=3051663 RepID=UPI0026077950|nr:hypothetical protein [Demequina sp. SYSU T00068]MDN4489251.1 hypothetical protein [Demequina sp. SYSU T00068]